MELSVLHVSITDLDAVQDIPPIHWHFLEHVDRLEQNYVVFSSFETKVILKMVFLLFLLGKD